MRIAVVGERRVRPYEQYLPLRDRPGNLLWGGRSVVPHITALERHGGGVVASVNSAAVLHLVARACGDARLAGRLVHETRRRHGHAHADLLGWTRIGRFGEGERGLAKCVFGVIIVCVRHCIGKGKRIARRIAAALLAHHEEFFWLANGSRVAIGDVDEIVPVVVHAHDIPHVCASARAAGHGSRGEEAFNLRVLPWPREVAQVLERLGVALTHDRGAFVAVEGPDELPGVSVGSALILCRSGVIRHLGAYCLLVRFELLEVRLVLVVAHDALCLLDRFVNHAIGLFNQCGIHVRGPLLLGLRILLGGEQRYRDVSIER